MTDAELLAKYQEVVDAFAGEFFDDEASWLALIGIAVITDEIEEDAGLCSIFDIQRAHLSEPGPMTGPRLIAAFDDGRAVWWNQSSDDVWIEHLVAS